MVNLLDTGIGYKFPYGSDLHPIPRADATGKHGMERSVYTSNSNNRNWNLNAKRTINGRIQSKLFLATLSPPYQEIAYYVDGDTLNP